MLLSHQARLAARRGELTAPTANIAPGCVQANLAILPKALADDFLRYCLRNPKPCPVLAVSEPGDPALPELGQDIDIRTDLPRYRIWRAGELVEEPLDVRHAWRDDLVTFAIGCSFSFEEAMLDNGLPVRHIEQGRNVPMYRTNVATRPAGMFFGPLVVSMRPLTPADAIRAIQVTSRFPSVHGAPVHFGDPAAIGIADIDRPDYGDRVDIRPGEVPVFWACGVTPQSVVAAAKPEFCITHAPGHMLVTDLPNSRIATL
jgi:uncharacterized protein YcsI (UPF0317 family)